jgi:mannose-6-phosphate isomerase-like protein (cupin superfamily)
VQDIEHPVSELSIDVGAHLRAVRTMYGLSQRELAKRAGVTNGLIPSVSSLKKVLDGIPMSLAEFFTLDFAASPQVFFRGDELPVMGDRSVTFKLVASRRPNRAMAVLHEHYAAGADTGADMLRHKGEEGGVVVSGRIELTVGAETRQLGPGDAYYFSSAIPHRFRNTGTEPCEIISANTPPTF